MSGRKPPRGSVTKAPGPAYFLGETTRRDFEETARARRDDFHALRKEQRWTASVYLAPYIVELRLKYKICEFLQVSLLPAPCKTHDLIMLLIYCGKYETEFRTNPVIAANLTHLNQIHRDEAWRYKPPDPSHKTTSDRIDGYLFDPTDGIIDGWLGI